MAQRTTSRIALIGSLVVALVWIVFLLTSSPGNVKASLAGSSEDDRNREDTDNKISLVPTETVRLGLERGEHWNESTADGPSVVDELLLLVAFDWQVDEILERYAAKNPLASAEALADLLSREPMDEETDGAGLILACLDGLGIGDEAAASQLYHWADRPEARQLMRSVARVLTQQGPRGRELAARLARSQWDRAQEDSADLVDFLCATHIVEELADARAAEAVPELRAMTAEAVAIARDAAASLEGVQERIQELSRTPESARDEWEDDPASERVARMWRWRTRATSLASALLRIDSPEVAEWIEESLQENGDGSAGWNTEILFDALQEVLPELALREDSTTIAKIAPWIQGRLASGIDETSWEFPAIYRLAGACGPAAVPALTEVVDRGGLGVATEEAVAGLALAARSTEDEGDNQAVLDTLREFLRGERRLGGERSSLETWGLVLETVTSVGAEEDFAWLQERIGEAPPDEVAMLLSYVPAEAWEGRPMALFSVLERMEPLLESDAAASSVVDLALERILDTVRDARPSLEPFLGSQSERMAQKSGAAILIAGLEHATSSEERLALLAARFHATNNPFRSQPSGLSLWQTAVKTAASLEPDIVGSELARRDAPLGLRVALGRALALHEDGTQVEALEANAATVALAAHESSSMDLRWARRFELSHWKTLAWLAVADDEGRRIAQGALGSLESRRNLLQPALADRLPLLEQYLEAMAASGWHVHEARLDELALAWNQGDDRARILAGVAKLCAEAPTDWLETVAARREVPGAVRARVLGRLLDDEDSLAFVLALAGDLTEAERGACPELANAFARSIDPIHTGATRALGENR